MSELVYNGTAEPLVKVYSGKYNVLIDSLQLDYVGEDGLLIERSMESINHKRKTGLTAQKIKGFNYDFTLDYSEFCTMVNYEKIVRIVNYFSQNNKKIILYPHRDGVVNYEVRLTEGIKEKVIYSLRTAIGYSDVVLKLRTKQRTSQIELYNPNNAVQRSVNFKTSIKEITGD